jgi:hypothetical protein
VQEQTEEHKALESLLTKLGYLALTITVSLLLIVGGIVKLAFTVALNGNNDWIGLTSLALGTAGITSVYLWLLIKRR